MKKTFPLELPGKDRARVLELVRSEVGKYINREKRKAPPVGHDRWEFACRVGPDANTATPVAVAQVHEAIGSVASSGAATLYVEVLATARPETPKAGRVSAGPGRQEREHG
jgi:hypothetical protein